MDGHGPLLIRQQGIGAVPAAQQHPIPGLGEVDRHDDVAAGPDGEDGRLVDQVGQIGPGEPGRPPGHHIEVDIGAELLALGMDLQDGPPFALGGEGDDDLAVEAARPEQGRVQGLGPVGGRHDHHPGGHVEAVQLGQQLVQGLVAFVVGDELAAPALADGVDLIDEHDRGGALAGLLEQVPDPGRPHPDEQLDEAAAGDRDERDVGLPGHRPGQQRLARAGGADHEHPLGPDGPGPPVPLRVFQEVDHLGDLPLDPFVAGHIGEGGVGAFRVEHPGARPTDAADPAHPGQLPAGRAARPQEEPQDDGQREQVEQDRPDRRLGRLGRDLHVVLVQQPGELGVLEAGRVAGGELRPVGELAGDGAVGAERDRPDLAGGEVALELAVAELHGLATGRDRDQEQRHGDQQAQEQQPVPPGRRGGRSGGGPDLAGPVRCRAHQRPAGILVLIGALLSPQLSLGTGPG
jgi:hypothetical protein